MTNLTSSLIIRLVDQVSRPARNVSNSLLGIRNAGQGLEGMSFGRRLNIAMRENDRSLANARGGLVDATAGFFALRAAIASPVQAAANFEASMDRVGALARANDDQLTQMTSTARELGATTNWSATQAAEGMQFYAMAGFSVNDTIAAMPGALALASAAQAELGATADITSNIMSGFGMQASEVGRIGDVLTNTFTSSNTDLQMLGHTMGYVAPVANDLGGSIETVAGMTGLLGNAGIQGSRAGTAMRAIYSRLAAPTEEAASALRALGVETTDANGNLRDMPDILADLDGAMTGMGTAARSEIIGTIAGMEAASAATVLITEAGTGALQDYIATLYERGSAERVAAEQLDNARGAFRRIASAWESLSISLGNALLPNLMALIETLIPVINRVDEFITANPQLAATLFQVAAGVIAFKIALAGLRFAGLLGRGGALSMLSFGLRSVQGAGRLAAASAVLMSRAIMGVTIGPLIAVLRRARMAMIGFSASASIIGTGGAIRMAAGSILSLLNPLRLLRGGLTLAAGAVRMLTTAVLANPIGLALAAVAAAGTWIYNNWDGIRAMFQGIGEGIRSAFEPAAPIFDALSASFETLFGWLGDLLGPIDATEAEWRDFGVNIGEWIGGAITSLIDMFNGFVEWLTGLPSMIIDAIGSISLSDIIQWPEPPDWWTALMGGLEPSETVSGAIGRGSMRRSRGSGPSIDGARASGGPVRAGGTYLVGEEGPELVTFGQSGFVHNTRATTNALSGARDAVSPGGAGGITLPDPNALTPQGIGATQGTPQTSAGDGVAVSITGPLTGPITITNGQNPMDFVDQIGERLEAELARRLRGLYADGI